MCRLIFLTIEIDRLERETNQEFFMISSNEKHISTGTNLIFILITEINHPITGEIDEEICFARQYLHFWEKEKGCILFKL